MANIQSLPSLVDPSIANAPMRREKRLPRTRIDKSRITAVKDLVAQGINDPSRILNMLNFNERGEKIGDFTIDEVQKYAGTAGRMRTVPASPGATDLPSYA